MKTHLPTDADLRRAPIVLVALVALLSSAIPAAAAPDGLIFLPGATSAEGIAVGRGSTFYAGDLVSGDIYRGDLQR
jgi:hypothetical protein